MTDTPILQLRGLNKSFGPVHVLHDVDFEIYPGQVTALVGDNGAGKSTLVKCIGGTYSIDSGEYLFEGKPVHVTSPRDSAALGIEIVYQDLALCDNLDIVQNMFLGRERLSGITLDEITHGEAGRRDARRAAVRTVKSVRQRVSSLSGGQRQTVAIAKRRALELQGRAPRRADRRPGRGPDRPGPRTGPQPGRQRPRRRADLAQHARRAAGLRPDRGPLPRPDGRHRRAQGRQPATAGRADHHRVDPATWASITNVRCGRRSAS